MSFAKIIKILLLVATIVQVALSTFGGVIPADVSAVLAAVAAAIFAFVKAIPSPSEDPADPIPPAE